MPWWEWLLIIAVIAAPFRIIQMMKNSDKRKKHKNSNNKK